MIVDHVKKFDTYLPLCKNFAMVSEFFKQNDIYSLPCGRHEIDGDNAFANVVERELEQSDNPLWEAHDEYIDIHLIIAGDELIGCTYLGEKHDECPYDHDNDCRLYFGLSGCECKLTKGMLCILFPHDVHSPNQPADSSYSKKIILKIRAD